MTEMMGELAGIFFAGKSGGDMGGMDYGNLFKSK